MAVYRGESAAKPAPATSRRPERVTVGSVRGCPRHGGCPLPAGHGGQRTPTGGVR